MLEIAKKVSVAINALTLSYNMNVKNSQIMTIAGSWILLNIAISQPVNIGPQDVPLERPQDVP